MIEKGLMVLPENNSFDERVESLARELDLAIRWGRACVLFVVYGSEFVREEVQAAIENHLVDLGQKIIHHTIKDQQTAELPALLEQSADRVSTVHFIQGLRWASNADPSIYTRLDCLKEDFDEKQLKAIFWLTCSEIKDLAHQAPDFWVYRNRAVEFIEAPRADQVMKEASGSAWQWPGLYEDNLMATGAMISMGEDMLEADPSGPETPSGQAHRLLALGVMNWRMGNLDKAETYLDEVMSHPEKELDAPFRAECLNAMALLKTSQNRADEAIEAYHQAIKLAPDQIFVWSNLGNLYLRLGKDSEAMKAYQKAVQVKPSDPVAWNGLGNVFIKAGDTENAAAAYKKSIQCLPTFALPWCGLGNAYSESGRNEEAMKAFQKAIELNGKDAQPWLQQARLYARQDLFPQAVQAYKQALLLDPNDSAIWNELGSLDIKNGAYEQAEECLLKAIELDRSNAQAARNLGIAMTHLGRSKESVSQFLRSIDLFEDPEEKATSWNRLGDAYRQLNDYDNAIAAYQTADMLVIHNNTEENITPVTETQPVRSNKTAIRSAEQVFSDTPVWLFDPSTEASGPSISKKIQSRNQRSTGLDRLPEPISLKPAASKTEAMPSGRPDPRPEEADESDRLESESTSAVVWNEKGNLHFKQGAIEEAINAYNKAIQFNTEFGWPYCNLAQAYVAQGQYTEAILLYERSIELLEDNQDKALCWNGLGTAHRRMGNYGDAVQAYQKAAELDPVTAGMRDGVEQSQSSQPPASAPAWNDLGEIFFKTGAYDEAIQAFEKAISMEPLAGWPMSNLARTLASQGKYALAIPLYQKSIELLQEDKDKAVTWNRLGNVYRKLNDYERAIQAYQKAVALTDEDAGLLTRTRFSLLSNLPSN